MNLAKDGRLASRVTIALLTAICVVAAAGAWGRAGQPALPVPAAGDYFAEAGARRASTTGDRIVGLQSHLAARPDDWPAYTQLGSVYLQKARETADPTYYQKAEAALSKTLAHEPGDYGALVALAELALARHEFARALTLGVQARDLNPSRSLAYGVITDAQVELGRYAEAVQTLQTMVDLRPDLSSYSRVSYLRELNGDPAGAIEAMQLAVEAGGPAAENTFWARTQLGHLHFNSGDLAGAEAQYQDILAVDPAYVHALAGLARVRAAQGRLDEAITLYTTVVTHVPLAEYVIALGDVYAAAGRPAEAQKQYGLVRAIDQLYQANGVNTDLELALFLADHGQAGDRAEAVSRARAAYTARPTINAADILAWALCQAGHCAEAAAYSQAALKLGTRDALKLYHAGLIALRLGQSARARADLEQALAINPYFSLQGAAEARRILAQLTQPVSHLE